MFRNQFCQYVTRLFFILFAGMALLNASAAPGKGVTIAELDGKLRVEINGQHFCDYNYKDVPRPYMYPIHWIDGTGLTRNYPMVEGVEGEEMDHIHHRGLWFGHRSVNGFDFWGETAKSCKIVHDEFLELKGGPEVGVISERNRWVDQSGKLVCTDERTIRIHNVEGRRMLDFEISIIAPDGDVVLGDDKDAGMSIRLPHEMKLTFRNKQKGTGHIINSEGVTDDDTWGKSAKWCDYYGEVEGRHIGVAILDHPQNPRFPTWWHVRNYGLFTANAFGKRHFEKLTDTHAGDLTIPAGHRQSWRYRFYWHPGDEKEGQVEEHWLDFAGSAKAGSQ